MTGRWRIIALSVLLWGSLAAYAVLAANHCSRRERERVCRGVEITVTDSTERGFVTPAIVRNMLVNDGIKITGRKINELNTLQIEKAVASRGYVRRARVYSSLDGWLHIEVEQRRPSLRVQSENGYGVYLTDDGYALPIQRYASTDVPIVTGIVPLPFARDFSGPVPCLSGQTKSVEKKYTKNEFFLQNLINFVGFLEEDSFWKGQVVQINVLANGDVELVPRVGACVILLGPFDGYREKLDKLMAFYRKGLAFEGWNKYAYLNIKFKGQVVCSN
ncbi:MAG: hypothetical protein LBU80_02490 [Rikenellaceae bacterium]|jgi:cell division protein FtsQ|nr:hypothetical protein [Rikenellaceae bacterium]